MASKNGLGDLIKNEITVSFGRNEDTMSEYANLAKVKGTNLSRN